MDLKGMYVQLFEAINEMDEKLDSLSDTESAGRRKISNDLVNANADTWQPVAQNAITQLSSMDQAARAGVYLGLIRELKKALDKDVNEFVDSQVETAPKVEPLISEEEAKEISAARSEAYKQIKQVVDLAVQFGEAEEDEWELPKVRRGSRGKRGKRALSLYSWFIDGNAVPEESNSPAGVAKLLGFEKAGAFTKWLREQEVNTSKPPATFEVTYGDKNVSAVRDDDVTDEEVEDDDDLEEEDDE